MQGFLGYLEILYVVVLVLVLAALVADKAKAKGALIQKSVFGATLILLLGVYILFITAR